MLPSPPNDGAQLVMLEPEGLGLIAAKGARSNLLLGFVHSPPLRVNMERERGAGEEINEALTIEAMRVSQGVTEICS